MRLGFTFDVLSDWDGAGIPPEELSELDQPATIQGLADMFGRLGFEVDRIGNARELGARLVAGERWPLVFNIAEGMYGYGREAQVPAMLDAWTIPYTGSDPLVMAVTLHKGVTKSLVRDAGLPTAPFAVIAGEDELAAVRLPWPRFVKPVAEGSSKGIGPWSLVTCEAEMRAACLLLWRRFRQPVLVETFLPGRDFTIGVVGEGPDAEVVAVMEIRFGETADMPAFSRVNKFECEERVTYARCQGREAREIGALALAVFRALGCRDVARVDVRSDADGRPHLLEVNALPSLCPHDSAMVSLARLAGLDFEGLIGRILASALRRHRLEPPPALAASLARRQAST